MLILVTYDINIESTTGPKRLRRVAKQCINYGVRVQNSVFECQVDAAQFTKLKHDILKEIDPEVDSVRFYVLGNNFRGKIEHYGIEKGIKVDEPLIL